MKMKAVQRAGLFLVIWLTAGFTAGTALLAGPVRWITAHGRERGWSEAAESWTVRFAILALVLVSALGSFLLTKIASSSPQRHIRFGLPVLTTVFAMAALWLWLTPTAMGFSSGGEFFSNASFTFGPYPDEQKLDELRHRGFTAVVSLLHPTVVPFELKLIGDGRAAAQRAGLEYVHIPMLPWVSDNKDAVERLRGLATDGAGRYYVHCYMGRDRVRIAQRVIEEASPAARTKESPAVAAHAGFRNLSDVRTFERGPIVQLDEDVWLIPYPTDDEFMSYLLAGEHGPVISLLDPDSEGDLPWIERERALLEGNGIPFINRPLSNDPFDPYAVLEVAEMVARGTRPVVVHAFLSAESGRAPTAEGFLQAFRSGLPPLPPTHFVEPLAGGPAEVIAPNVAIGPRPAGPEFGSVLHRRGVRSFVFAGPAKDARARDDGRICDMNGLEWRAVENPEELAALLRQGGPYYVYGPLAEEARFKLATAIGPAMPTEMLWNPRYSGRLARLWSSFVPSPKMVVLLGPFLLVCGVLAAAAAAWLRQSRGVRAPYTRKLFHFTIFTAAGLLHLAVGLQAVALFGGVISLIVLYGVWRGDGFGFYEALARPTDAPHRTLFILVPLATTALGGVLSNLMFGTFATIGYLVCGWGDAVGEPVGTRYGKHRYRVPSIGGVVAWRSWEGSAAVYVVGTLAACLGLLLAGYSPATAMGIGLACALAGTAVEAFSNHGLDNLTVQLAAAGVAWLLLG